MKFTEEQLRSGFTYLTMLRNSKRTNMWGAPSFMARETSFTDEESKEMFFLWQDTLTEYDMPIDDQVRVGLELQT